MKLKTYKQTMKDIGVDMSVSKNGIVCCSYADAPLLYFGLTLDSLAQVRTFSSNFRLLPLSKLTRMLVATKKFIATPYDKRGLKQQRYTVQVIKGSKTAYLNKDLILTCTRNECFFDNMLQYGGAQTQFTQFEIDQLKQRDDIAIDWDKAIIKPVDDDE